jgi:hypothetical protein
MANLLTKAATFLLSDPTPDTYSARDDDEFMVLIKRALPIGPFSTLLPAQGIK